MEESTGLGEKIKKGDIERRDFMFSVMHPEVKVFQI